MPRIAHKPTAEQRKTVETMAAYGIPASDIAKVVGIGRSTLDKYYREELDRAETIANAKVAGFLYKNAEAGNVTAQIFWLKTRARWKEQPTVHQHSGAVGTYDLSKATDEELERLESVLRSIAVSSGNPSGEGAT